MKWEYKIVDYLISGDREQTDITENQINGAGEEGWEAVTVWKDGQRIYVLFKRPWKS